MTIRHNVLKNRGKKSCQRFLTLKSLSTTHWNYRNEAISYIKNKNIILYCQFNIKFGMTLSIVPAIRAKDFFKQL